MKKFLKVFLLSLLVVLTLAPSVSAIVPYTSYIYTIDGVSIESPHAYVPDKVIDSSKMGLNVALDTATDLETDKEGNIYIADPKNNRIIVIDSEWMPKMFIDTFVNSYGIIDSLNNPSGVFILEDEIYVADTNNARIVVFNRIDGSYIRVVGEPVSDVFPDNHIYRPIALAVDRAGRLYVVSSTTHYGVIQMNKDGSFVGFLGAQKTSPSAWQLFWRMFQTEEQRARSEKLVPTEYNNITIDSEGFIYVTTSSLDKDQMLAAITGKSRSGDYAPVKKLNPLGSDVMMRTGFWPPSGEVEVNSLSTNPNATTGVSTIVDVALGDHGMWSIIDSKRSKIYTYDSDGNLLFVFGDKGSQLGNAQNINAITYHGTDILVMDRATGNITIYKRTIYGNAIASALKNQNDRNYDQAAIYWEDILQRNNNFDQAYVGIGDSYYRAGDYEEAKKYYAYAYDTEDYSEAFKKTRKAWIEKWLFIIPLVIIVVCVGFSKFLSYANKVNKAGQVTKDKRTFKEAVLYGFHIIFHPFDGFWDLKHEKRGNLKGAIFFVAFAIVGFIVQGLFTGFIFDPYSTGVNFFAIILSILTPFFLWCVSNWCLTTLFDGEGSFKDICIATSYSLVPLPLLMIPATLITNVLALEEYAIVGLIIGIAYVWTGFLLFFGMMVIHDYTIGKNILTTLATIVGMAFIMFVGVLFSGLITKVVSFVYNLYIELSYR